MKQGGIRKATDKTRIDIARELWNAGKSSVEVAAAINCTPQHVRVMARRYEWEPHQKNGARQQRTSAIVGDRRFRAILTEKGVIYR